MEVWDSSRIPKTVVRQASPTVKPVEARLTLSCHCICVIFFGPKDHFVMNKYLYYWTWNLVIILLLYVWFEHPGHTYGSFVPSFSERGMTRPHFLATWSAPKPNSTRSFPIAFYPLRTQCSYAWKGNNSEEMEWFSPFKIPQFISFSLTSLPKLSSSPLV
jgi:hypothetical protein